MLHFLKDKYEEDIKILIYVTITFQAQLITQRCAANLVRSCIGRNEQRSIDSSGLYPHLTGSTPARALSNCSLQAWCDSNFAGCKTRYLLVSRWWKVTVDTNCKCNNVISSVFVVPFRFLAKDYWQAHMTNVINFRIMERATKNLYWPSDCHILKIFVKATLIIGWKRINI